MMVEVMVLVEAAAAIVTTMVWYSGERCWSLYLLL